MRWVDLNRRDDVTLTRQIYDQLVARIPGGEFSAGTRLPSSRELAAEPKVARNIVVEMTLYSGQRALLLKYTRQPILSAHSPRMPPDGMGRTNRGVLQPRGRT